MILKVVCKKVINSSMLMTVFTRLFIRAILRICTRIKIYTYWIFHFHSDNEAHFHIEQIICAQQLMVIKWLTSAQPTDRQLNIKRRCWYTRMLNLDNHPNWKIAGARALVNIVAGTTYTMEQKNASSHLSAGVAIKQMTSSISQMEKSASARHTYCTDDESESE